MLISILLHARWALRKLSCASFNISSLSLSTLYAGHFPWFLDLATSSGVIGCLPKTISKRLISVADDLAKRHSSNECFSKYFQIASHSDSTISQYREDNVWILIVRRNFITGSWKRFLALWPPFRLGQSTVNAGTNLFGDIAGTDPTQLNMLPSTKLQENLNWSMAMKINLQN